METFIEVDKSNVAETLPGSIVIINYATFDSLNQHRQKANIKWAQEWAKQALTTSNNTINTVDIVSFGPDALDANFREYNNLILRCKKGAGYWIWKPYIITSMLFSTNAEFLVYCDSGSSLKITLEEAIQALQKSSADILVFELQNYPEFTWTKRQVLREMNATEPVLSNSPQIAATASVWRVCTRSKKLAQKWLYLMQNPVFATDLPSNDGGEFPGFKEHRRDQSVFSILIKKAMLYESPENPIIIKRDFETCVYHHHFG